MEKRRYGMFVKTNLPYDEALEQTRGALREQGFGVLTQIDVKATMKEKLGVDFRHYDIIGACNPPLAHGALSSEIDIGLLLPCNVVVYEDDGGTTIGALDPEMMMGMTGNAALSEVAGEAKERLQNALARLGS
jgi:uncharacterized protein (DUF302 family)